MGQSHQLYSYCVGYVHQHHSFLPITDPRHRRQYVRYPGHVSVKIFVWCNILTKAYRNYAVCVAAFIAAFALIWWWLTARG